MITNQERMEAALEDPYILVTDRKISSVQELLPILEKIVTSGKKELVIIAEEIEGEALATLVVNKLRGIFNVLAVKSPGFGDRKKEMLQDIAIVTGAELISEDLGKKIESVELAHLGHASRVVSNKDATTIVGGKGEKKAIDDRIAQLKAQIKKTDSDYDKEKLQERLGKLSGGVAVLRVGAPTESAQKELKQRVEDAVAATRAAMEEGIVPGGGVALFNAFSETAQGDAMAIMNETIQAPIRAIVANSGESPDKIIEQIKKEQMEKKNRWIGFNAVTDKVQNLKEAGIIDPLKVVKMALVNAVSVASTYLTIGAAVTDVPKKEGNHDHAGSSMPPMDY